MNKITLDTVTLVLTLALPWARVPLPLCLYRPGFRSRSEPRGPGVRGVRGGSWMDMKHQAERDLWGRQPGFPST